MMNMIGRDAINFVVNGVPPKVAAIEAVIGGKREAVAAKNGQKGRVEVGQVPITETTVGVPVPAEATLLSEERVLPTSVLDQTGR